MKFIGYLSTLALLSTPLSAAQKADIEKLEKALPPSTETSKPAPLDLSGHDMRKFGTLSGATLEDCRMFNHANLQGANFSGMTIDDIRFEDVNFNGADFSQCTMRKVSFINCRMNGAKMNQINGESVRFRSCNMAGANLTSAKLNHSGFAESNLAGANLSDTDLAHVRFYRSLLTDVNLSNAQLYKVSFEKVRDMTGMKTNGMKTEDVSVVPCF